MDFKRGVLEILLRRIRPEQISLHTSKGYNDYRGAKKEFFLPAARVHLPDNTEDENEQLYMWAKDQLTGKAKEEEQELLPRAFAGIYGMIADVASAFLEIKNDCFYYQDWNWTVKSQFFHWKELVTGLGQDVFMMALLADKHTYKGVQDDEVSQKDSLPNFLCQLFPQVSDPDLRRLLGQDGSEGLAENHFHLKGSFPIFLLNWTCLMNHVGDGTDFFHKMKEYREVEQLTEYPDKKHMNLFQAAIAAASYRIHLFEVYSRIPDEARMPFSYDMDPDETELGMLQRQIEYYRGNLEPHWDGERMVSALDYALADQWETCFDQDEGAVAGERYFLFRCFWEIFKKESCFHTEERNLFYKYLLIAFRIRSELVQTNQSRGFGNFGAYQDRKEEIIDHYPEYEPHVVRLTACSLRRRQNLSSMELRISPKPTAGETLDRLEGYRGEIGRSVSACGKNERDDGTCFFVLHFPKERERKRLELQARNSELRQKMNRQIEEQKQLIRIEQSNYIYGGRLPMVRGYDTCSGEIGCRPEVFAQFYRDIQAFARDCGASWIHWTYHVGEDFLDLVDGLRAIDEAVRFCELPSGSRLGHGMALGIDAIYYYEMKQWKLLLPGQDLLDNIVWTLGFCQEFGIVIKSGLKEKLEKKYVRLHKKIYGTVPMKAMTEQENRSNNLKPTGKKDESALNENEHSYDWQAEKEAAFTQIDLELPMDAVDEEDCGRVFPDWQSYYKAWKLRGDWPEFYADDVDDGESQRIPLPGTALRKSEGEKLDEIRADKICQDYYRRYHFSEDVREKGEQLEPFEVNRSYAELIGRMQEELRYQLTEKNIGIECNPTSNYKIGPFDRFDHHPMLRMYGKNLEEGAASRMCISINTDDMGVFQTSLETEYAAMYVALRKSRDGQGRFRYQKAAILKWLEDVKTFGNKQTFGLWDGVEE